MRALKISLGILALTAASQVVIVVISGSVALLADTVHNFSDALTAILIGIAFVLGWRLANRRYTYGYGRAEDIAGLFVLLTMLASALLALFGRMMDRVDETVVIDAEITVAAVDGVLGVDRIRMRLVGHGLLAEVDVQADRPLDLVASHDLADTVRDRLIATTGRLLSIAILDARSERGQTAQASEQVVHSASE